MKVSRMLVSCMVFALAGCSVLHQPSHDVMTQTITGDKKVERQVRSLEAEGVLNNVIISETLPLQFTVTGSKSAVSCLSKGGQWLKKYQECEYISPQSCSNLSGTFEECASACRHQRSDILCIQVCVPVCTLK